MATFQEIAKELSVEHDLLYQNRINCSQVLREFRKALVEVLKTGCDLYPADWDGKLGGAMTPFGALQIQEDGWLKANMYFDDGLHWIVLPFEINTDGKSFKVRISSYNFEVGEVEISELLKKKALELSDHLVKQIRDSQDRIRNGESSKRIGFVREK